MEAEPIVPPPEPEPPAKAKKPSRSRKAPKEAESPRSEVTEPSADQPPEAGASPAPAMALGDFQRPPAPIPAGARSSGAIALVFRRGPTGKGTRMRLPKKATAAEAVSWLVGNVVPVRTDLTGRLTSWYRLSNSGGPIAPDTSLSSLDADDPIVIETVLNGARLVELTVAGPSTHRFVAPVGTAVPVVTLIDHITRWLGLPDLAYQLHGPDGALSPHHILADIDDASAVLSLSLKVADGEGGT
jgi:hypothetical protein